MNQSDKAYYLKNLELALLLSIKGMKSLYGFKMEDIRQPAKAAIYQTLFELEKKELIEVGGDKAIRIYPELDQILEDIKNAERMLLYICRASEYPDLCIYLGNRAVLVSSYGTAGDINRIQSVPEDELADKICENGFSLEEIVSDESLFIEEPIEDPELEEKAVLLFPEDFAGLEDKAWGNIVSSLKMISLESREYQKQYLLMKGGLHDYFAVTDEKTCIYPYSKKIILETLKKDILCTDGEQIRRVVL